LDRVCRSNPGLPAWAIFDRPFGAKTGLGYRPTDTTQFCGNSAGLPLVGIGAPPAGIEVTGIICDRPGVTVMVVGIGWALMPEVIMWLVVVGVVAHWPLAHGLAEVDFDPQQVLHPTAPKRTREATPAACRSFFI
jgi:hypothetical protein